MNVTLLPPVSRIAACPEAIDAMLAETSCVLPAAHCSAPPLKRIAPAPVGIAPATKSSVPAERDVPPLYAFAELVRNSAPAPSLARTPLPLITPP